jgi:ankyrin repeat protein
MDLLCNFWNSNNLLYQIKQRDITEAVRILTNQLDQPIMAWHYVAKNGYLDWVQLLLEHNVNPNIIDYDGVSALHLTASMSYAECFDLILQELDTNHSEHHIRTLTCLTVLVKYGAQINLQNKNGSTPLFYSILNRNTDKTLLLLEYGADFDLQDNSGSTVLHLTIYDHKLDPALWNALIPSRIDFVRLLLKYKCDVNIQNKYGCTALHLAIIHSDLEIIKLLLTDSNLNLQDHNGETVLHYASKLGALDKCELLLQYGTNSDFINLKNNRDQTALELAVLHGYEEIAHLLIINRSNLYIKKINVKSPIMQFIVIKQMERICDGLQKLRLLRLHYIILKLWKQYWYEDLDEKGCNRHCNNMIRDAIKNGWVTDLQ